MNATRDHHSPAQLAKDRRVAGDVLPHLAERSARRRSTRGALVEGSRVYWDESVYYQFEAREIDEIEECTNRLNECCLQAVQHVIDHDLFARVGIPAHYIEWVKRSWSATSTRSMAASTCATTARARRSCSNTTPTRRPVCWRPRSFSGTGSRMPGPRTINSTAIHEKLIDIFKTLRTVHEGRFYFAALAGNLEDFMTVNYLRDCAMQAGLGHRIHQRGGHRLASGPSAIHRPERTAHRAVLQALSLGMDDARTLWPELVARHMRLVRAAVEDGAEQQGHPGDSAELFPDSPYLLDGLVRTIGIRANTCASRSTGGKAATSRW